MENKTFFDPYNFQGPYINTNLPPNVQMPPNMEGDPFLNPGLSPKEFYDGQYFYYRYLTQVLEYRIKQKEYERTCGTSTKKDA